jgi:MFS transporter, DHA2 family, multidrug resistance protein
MLFTTQHLQLVEGLSPLRAGLWMLPATAASTVSFLLAPLLARRIRPAHLIGAGLTISVTGLLVLTQAGAADGLTAVVSGFALINLGAGPLVTLGVGLVVGSAPPETAGSAASINETSGQLGFALGIAALGSIGAAIYRAQIADTIPAGIPTEASRAARDTLAGATAAASTLPEDLAAALLTPAREAFTSGLNTVAAICAVLLAGVAILAVTLLRHVPPIGQPTVDDAECDSSDAAVLPPVACDR